MKCMLWCRMVLVNLVRLLMILLLSVMIRFLCLICCVISYLIVCFSWFQDFVVLFVGRVSVLVCRFVVFSDVIRCGRCVVVIVVFVMIVM